MAKVVYFSELSYHTLFQNRTLNVVPTS